MKKKTVSEDQTAPRAVVQAADCEIEIHCAHDALIPTDHALENPQNPNTHTDQQIDLLTNAMRKQGWRGGPVTISKLSGLMTKGHGRKKAAQKLGMQQVPAEYQPYPTAEAEYADMVADNAIADLSEFDAAVLAAGLQDLEATGYEMDLTGLPPGIRAAFMSSPADALNAMQGAFNGEGVSPSNPLGKVQVTFVFDKEDGERVLQQVQALGAEEARAKVLEAFLHD